MMRRDLAAPIAMAPLPAGMRLVPFGRETAWAGRELMKLVYPEGLNDGGISFDAFWGWLTTHPQYDADLMFVAEAKGVVVGFCHCWREAYIKNLVVHPDFRQRGLGGALMTCALRSFARRDAPWVELETESDNMKAQSLYRRLGFVMVETKAG
jgi:ribosomal protein S18 acetylase RimI-like enzyme